nr:hypothetical protein [Kibdelosporangium sp. MJ126-NF4]CTQ96703.1 hypothetical protein [Kibdelosporangium sp. MJ126-NF4]
MKRKWRMLGNTLSTLGGLDIGGLVSGLLATVMGLLGGVLG